MRTYWDLEKLRTSNRIADVIKFYDSFKDDKELIRWMKNRPNREYTVYEKPGKKDIVVVIPTINHRGRLATNSIQIFSGLHIIFIESKINSKYNPSFTFSRSANTGLKYALRYKPKWVILANDDMYTIDNLDILKNELSKLDPKSIDAAFAEVKNGTYVDCISTPLFTLKLYRSFANIYLHKLEDILSKFNVRLRCYKCSFKNRLLYSNPLAKFTCFGPFVVFSYEFLKKNSGMVFDEVFLTGSEDVYLSYKLSKNKNRYIKINYEIGHLGSKSGAHGNVENLRYLANEVYLNHLLEKELL